MAFHPEDRVAHTSTDVGTGNLAVSTTAPAGYITLTTAGYVAGDTFDAVIVPSDASPWESSLCQMVDATHIARNQVYSNGLGSTARINFTNVSKTIFVTFPAARQKTLVAGPASSTANDLASYGDGTGKVIADSGIPLGQVARKDQPFIASGTGHAAGVVPDPGATAGTTRYLREDATWATPAGGGGGSVTSVALTVPADETVTGSPITTSGTLAITRNAQSGNVFLASPLNGSSAVPTYRALGPADYPAFVASGASHARGAVPDPGATAGTTHYLREDASWVVPPVGIISITASAPLTGGTITTSGTIGISVFIASGASHASGIVPDPGATAGTTRYLREDATWVVPPGTGVTSITASAPLTGGVITTSGTIGISVFAASGASHASGVVPDPGATAGTARYLREDATWATPPGAGTVTSITAAAPLTGGTITTTGTIGIPIFAASGASHASGAVPDPGATAGTARFLCENATWSTIPGIGTPGITDVYVDTTNGTDAPGQGLSAGAGAYKTIQYAVNQLPRLLFNSVTVHIAAGIYREQVVVQGLFLAGPYTLTFLGVNGTDILGDTTGASWSNPAGNGANGWTIVTNPGAAWTLNAFRGKLFTITSGTGAGQTFVVHSNTATQLVLCARVGSPYLGGTIGDTTSHFHIYNWGTRVTGSNAGADTTPVRNLCFQIIGVAGVVLSNLQLDYAANTCVDVKNYASVDLQYCWLANSAHYGVHCYNLSSATNGIQTCVFSGNHDYDINMETGSTFSMIARTQLTSVASQALRIMGMANISYGIIECHLNNTGGWQMYVGDGANVKIGDYSDVDGTGAPAGSHGIFIDTAGRVNFSMITNATAVVHSNGGWGVIAQNGGQGENVAAQVSSWTGNVSGNYTPTTALPGGNT